MILNNYKDFEKVQSSSGLNNEKQWVIASKENVLTVHNYIEKEHLRSPLSLDPVSRISEGDIVLQTEEDQVKKHKSQSTCSGIIVRDSEYEFREEVLLPEKTLNEALIDETGPFKVLNEQLKPLNIDGSVHELIAKNEQCLESKLIEVSKMVRSSLKFNEKDFKLYLGQGISSWFKISRLKR